MGIIGHRGTKAGFSLIEILVGATVFAIVSMAIYQSYAGLLSLVNASKTKEIASALANEQFEIVRNLPYVDVGIVSGVPVGKIPRFQTFVRSGITFQSTTTIRNIDDPFDGQIGSTTAPDLSPADYKVVEIEIGCSSCRNFQPLLYTSNIAPKNLETSSTNGALFIKVFDANGLPLSGARVQVVNVSASPAINIDEVTNAQGILQIVDAPPGTNTYQVTVSRSGYSTDKTYSPGTPPNPLQPHATVALQQVTQVSLSIDQVSAFNVSTVASDCSVLPNINFTLSGSKLIGTAPDTLKYNSSFATDGTGSKSIPDLEWDTYQAVLNNVSYVLEGAIPPAPFSLSPNSTQNVSLVLVPVNARQLHVFVKDSSSGLPVSDATVQFELNGYDQTRTTDRGFNAQSDWSGGSGQSTSTDVTKFFSSDGNIEHATIPGELSLKSIFGEYQTPGTLLSSTYDLGAPSNFYQILWNPGSQPVDTGVDSVKFQIATNNNASTWSYKGPDGTASTHYTLSDQNVNSVHNGDRYLRYKLFMSTASTTVTPTLSDVSISYTSQCTPPGQVLFSAISQTGSGTLTVTKSGYQTYSTDVSISSSYQSVIVPLSQ